MEIKIAHLGLLVSSKVIEYSSDRFAFGISHGSQSVAGNCSQHESREVGNDKANSGTADSTEPGPPGYSSFDFGSQELCGVMVSDYVGDNI